MEFLGVGDNLQTTQGSASNDADDDDDTDDNADAKTHVGAHPHPLDVLMTFYLDSSLRVLKYLVLLVSNVTFAKTKQLPASEVLPRRSPPHFPLREQWLDPTAPPRLHPCHQEDAPLILRNPPQHHLKSIFLSCVKV